MHIYVKKRRFAGQYPADYRSFRKIFDSKVSGENVIAFILYMFLLYHETMAFVSSGKYFLSVYTGILFFISFSESFVKSFDLEFRMNVYTIGPIVGCG